jgi:hypothetical protein
LHRVSLAASDPQRERLILGSRPAFVWWPNDSRPKYLAAALIAGLAFKLLWTGAGYLPGTAGENRVQIDSSWGNIIGVLVAFVVASGNWVLRQSAKDWSRIETVGYDRAPLEAKAFAPGRRPVIICSLTGMLIGILQLWATGDMASLRVAHPPTFIAASILVILFWMLVAQVGGTFLILIRGFYKLGLRTEPDPLRIESLAPFSFVGLRILAVNAVMSAIMITAVGLRGKGLDLIGLAVPLGATAMVSVPCFLLPQLGVRQSLRRTKRRMLAQLDDMLNQTGFPAPSAFESDELASKVASLATLRAKLAAAPDWPVTGIVWLRFAVILLLPAVSWVANKLLSNLLA